MITTTYNYQSGTGFLYDNTKIGFVSSQAKLLLNGLPNQHFIPTISASTYDSALLSYGGGALSQIDQRPPNATFYAAWNDQLNGNWGDGTTTVLANNGAAVTNSVLDLTGAVGKYVTIFAPGNASSAQTGTIEFKYTPNYTAVPATTQMLFCIFETLGSNHNAIRVYHYSNGGGMYMEVYDTNGSQIIQTAANFFPSSGTTYTIRMTYNGAAGASLFVDGSQLLTSNASFTRDASSSILAVGTDYDLDQSAGNANFSISNFSVYSTVTSPASPVLPPYIYATAVAHLPLFTYAGLGDVQAYTSFVVSQSNMVRFVLNGRYWDGSAWSASDSSYAQASLNTSIEPNLGSFPAADTLQVLAVYPDGSLQGALSSCDVTYTGEKYPTTGATIAPNSPLTMDELSQFVATSTAVSPNSVTWYMMIGSLAYWWNGTAWAISSGVFAQSNTAADVQTNLSSLPISSGEYVTPYAILTSGDGTSTPMLASLSLTYDYFGPMPGGPNVCTVFGYIFDEKNAPLVGATVFATNLTTVINQGVAIAQSVRSAVTNNLGYFSLTLVETATISATLNWAVTYTAQQANNTGVANPPSGSVTTTYVFGEAAVPNVPEANFATLIFA